MSDDSYSEFTISATFPLDIYVGASADSDPNEFQHDLSIKKTNYFKLSSQHFPSMDSFVAAVRVNGIQDYNTIFNLVNVQAKFTINSVQSMIPKIHKNTNKLLNSDST